LLLFYGVGISVQDDSAKNEQVKEKRTVGGTSNHLPTFCLLLT
jgi:hypothetical protein